MQKRPIILRSLLIVATPKQDRVNKILTHISTFMYIHAYIYIHVYIYIYTLYIHCRRILSKHYSPTSQHVYIYTHIHIYTFKSDMLHIHCHRILSKSYSPTTHQSASQHRGHSTTHGSMEVSFFPLFFV